jgi:hypothetical protein
MHKISQDDPSWIHLLISSAWVSFFQEKPCKAIPAFLMTLSTGFPWFKLREKNSSSEYHFLVGGVTQAVRAPAWQVWGPEFKLQCWQNKTKQSIIRIVRVSINCWMNRENVVYIYCGVLFNHWKKNETVSLVGKCGIYILQQPLKKECNCVICRKMEIILLSEISKIQKDKYSMFSLKCRIKP